MSTITCPPAEQLKAFYLGQLPDDRSDELVAHVGICSACQAELETVVDAEDSLIANLREPDAGSNLDREPACEMGMLRALGALATAYEPNTAENSSDSEDAALPKTIGEYEIVRALGQGGMGHVYLARHSKLGRLVALKILAGHRLGDRRASQRFEAEMRAIGRLSHPNIVTAHDAREIDGTAVLVTEFIDGFDLGQLLQRTGPLAVADACDIIRQVALALQYTSDQGFVHRDVKPSNIMLSASGEVKLLDLGLARLQFGDVESADVTGTGQTMGTADYISPEQVTDSRKVDVRSDIYSLGVTLFKLLVGRAPFADAQFNTAFAKMTAHVSTTPANVRSLRNDVPEELSRLVASMLAKRPEDRPQTPDAIAVKLSAFAEGNNLELLARTAALVDVTQAASNSVTTSIEPKTLTQSFWHRPVKLYLAIASGLVGIVLGFCFGIIITITNPDGSKTVMKLPTGSKVEVSEGEAKPLKNDAQAVDCKTDAFLEFGVVINPAQARLVRMVPDAGNVTLSNPLKTSHYDPKTDQKLVSIDATHLIRADQIWGHILEAKLVKTGNSNALELTFDEGLSQRILELTSAHIGHQLAIIVEGKVVAAPRINTPISSKAVLEGRFTPEELERLKKWLSAAQTTAPQTTAPQTATKDLGVTPKIPAPTFNGHTLDEWLTLLETEQSRNGQIAAIQGLKGLLTEQNSDRILDATLALIDSQKPQTPEEYELVRLLLGPDAYGKWLIEQLNKNDVRLTKSILIGHSDRTGKPLSLRPEHYLIAQWLADPAHQLAAEPESTDIREITRQDCVRFFLYDMFYASDLKGDMLEMCFRATRNQPAIGDADTFLLGVPCKRRCQEDERLRVFADLALGKLLGETSDVLQATRAMSILVTYPQLIPKEKIQALTVVTQKRFEALLQSRERIGALVDQAASHFVIGSIKSPSNKLIWHPSESACSETLSLLYFTHFLGAPAELESFVAKLRDITRPEHERAVGIGKKGTESSEDCVAWPFDLASNQKHNPKIISEIGPEAWRAAYYDLIANLVQRSFERRKKAADELAGREAAAYLNEAMRDFARVDKDGDGEDVKMTDWGYSKQANDSRASLLKSIDANFKAIDADSNGMLSVTEYARYLADKSKQKVNSTVSPSQPLVPSQSPEEELAPSDFGDKPSVPTRAKEHNREFSDALYAFALSLTEDRNAPITQQNVERLAAKLMPHAGKDTSKATEEAIRKSWPFKSVSSVLPGVPPEANWLLSDQETGYTILLKREAILDEIRTFVDAVTGQRGVFNDIWTSLKNDPQGPRIDGDEIIKHLGNHLILCVGKETHPVNLVAVSLTNTEAVQAALRNTNDGPETFRVVKNYLVMGAKERVKSLVTRSPKAVFEGSSQSTSRALIGSTRPRQLALVPRRSAQQQREQFVEGLIELLNTIDDYIKPPRKTTFDDHDVARLAERFDFLASNPSFRFHIRTSRIQDAVRAASPLNGITEIREGVDNESGWLMSVNKRVFRMTIKPGVFYNDIKNAFDASFSDTNQVNGFEQIVAATDLANLVDHLRGQVFFVLSSQGDIMVALESDNPAAMLPATRKLAGAEQTIHIVGEYLVLGPKQLVEEAAISFAARSPNPTSELVRISFAFQGFHEAHKRLPAAKSSYLPNQPKKLPPYSWRVAILPFIGRESLYREYDFNEPWDSEKNLKLLDKMPRFYRSPHAPADQKTGDTNFLAFVGETTAMANEAGVYLNDIRDGSSTTVLLVETKRSVPWTKPEDLPFNGLQDAKLAQPFDGLDLNCLMVDGTVLSLKQPINWQRLGSMVTRNGGEVDLATPNSVYASAAAAQSAAKYEDFVSCFDVKSQEIMLGTLVTELSNVLPDYEMPDNPAASRAKQIRAALNSHKLNEEAIAKLNLPNISAGGAAYEALSSVAKVVDDRALCLAGLIRVIRETKYPAQMIPIYQGGELREVKIEGDSATAVQPEPNGGKVDFIKVDSNWLIQIQLP